MGGGVGFDKSRDPGETGNTVQWGLGEISEAPEFTKVRILCVGLP